MKALVVIALMTAFSGGMYIGEFLNGLATRPQLIDVGCAHYDQKTGEFKLGVAFPSIGSDDVKSNDDPMKELIIAKKRK